MIRLSNIWKVVLFGMILSSCTNDMDNELQRDEGVEIPIPKYGYIFFNTGMNTRGTLIQGKTLEADFSVLGYRFQTDWGTVKPQAKQTLSITYTDNDGNSATGNMGVFYGTESGTVPTAQKVVWNGSAHSYTPLQGWQKNLTYAFFAWHPADLIANGGSSDYEGNPYIEYNLPTGSDNTARASMYDVMTACKLKASKADGVSVQLDMQHRLAALDVWAGSLINAKALKDTWGTQGVDGYVSEWDNATLADNAEVMLKVTNFKISLTNIKSNVRIPLNTLDTGEVMTASGELSPTYTGYAETTGIGYYTSTSDLKSLMHDDKLILIPQEDDISVTIELDYTIECNGATKTFTYQTAPAITLDRLEEGKYHYLVLTFTKSGLFVKDQGQNSWEEKKVDYEFE